MIALATSLAALPAPQTPAFNTLIASASVLQSVQEFGIATSGGVVSAWADQSGAGKNYTASGAAQPTYNIAGLNGFPTLVFDGVNDEMIAPLTLGAPGTVPTFIWMIFRQLSWVGNTYIVGTETTGNSCNISPASVSPQIQQTGPNGVNLNAGAPIGTWVRCEAYFNNSIGDYLKLGSTKISGAAAGPNATATNRSIGGRNGAGFTHIEVAALMYVQGLPTPTELAALDTAVTIKYGGMVQV